MATFRSGSVSKMAAPWRDLFLEHVSKMQTPEFVMATLQPAAASTSSGATGQPPSDSWVPRLRYLVFRGMWSELPENRHNDAPRNEAWFRSDMPTFTTDARMEKVAQLSSTSAGHGSRAQPQGSGGGGPVEAVWWVKEAMTQWRVRGNAFVVGPDIDEPASDESSGARAVKSEVGKRMRLAAEHADGAGRDAASWSWARELTAHFGNMSPVMRGSFKGPPPGTPVSSSTSSTGNADQHGLRLGEKVSDLDDRIARQNFRVVVIRPSVVERLDLGDPARSRRHRYTFVGPGSSSSTAGAASTSASSDDDSHVISSTDAGDGSSEWTEVELWP